MIRALKVKAIENYLIVVSFENGEERVYDCNPLLDKKLFCDLKNEEYFQTVHIDEMGIVCWDDSTDIAPDELYNNSVDMSIYEEISPVNMASEWNDEACIEALDKILKEHFNQAEYCLYGESESAICLDYDGGKWIVFEKEKNSKNDLLEFNKIEDACIDIIKRMFIEDANLYEEKFLNSLG